MKTQIDEALFESLQAMCALFNRAIFEFYESRASCIFSTAVVCDVLRQTLNWPHIYPMRVEAAVFRERGPGCILGSAGDGTRRPAAEPGMWRGHLVTVIQDSDGDEEYLIDTTLDQVNDNHPELDAKPCVVYLPHTPWREPPRWEGALKWTGNMPIFGNGATVRYVEFHRQNGWKSAGDFRLNRRKRLVERLMEPIWQLMP
jgi:hypothetical protein